MLRFVFNRRLRPRQMAWVYSLAGVCFMLFPVVLVIEVARWLPFFPNGLESVIALIVTAILALYALINAQRTRVKTVKVKATAELQGQSIVQLSDVHVGSRTTSYFDAVIEKVKSLDPTRVVITGDLIDASHVGVNELRPLQKIAEKTLFVIGNHERYEGLDRLTRLMDTLGVTTLRNQEAQFDGVQYVGIDDHDSPNFLTTQLKRFEPEGNAFRVLLYHRPHGIQAAAEWGFHLMLVGHTHRGQIFPFRFVVKRFFDLTHGTHRIGDMVLHISSGTGTWGPALRLGSYNEITQIVFT